jgi:hypothetical protein
MGTQLSASAQLARTLLTPETYAFLAIQNASPAPLSVAIVVINARLAPTSYTLPLAQIHVPQTCILRMIQTMSVEFLMPASINILRRLLTIHMGVLMESTLTTLLTNVSYAIVSALPAKLTLLIALHVPVESS